jgi:UDP-N-acetylglucosamine--N-acetylmuramyl-(pentapeptide) pyrophosphoryl-undecaprenol N-acetylglucosamine transferase
VFGGSLGARVINEAVAGMLEGWDGPALQVVHLVGKAHSEVYTERAAPVRWVRRAFEDRMELFYAASDLVIARAGGAVAEISATATPSVLVPGEFGSTGHQVENAAYLEKAGAAVVVPERDLGTLRSVLTEIMSDPSRLDAMAENCRRVARPDAAKAIAEAMIEASR